MPGERLSDRPTFVPADYVEPRLESPPTVSIGEPTPLEGSLEEASSPANHALEPLVTGSVPVAGDAGALSPRRLGPRRSGRMHFARILFVVLFGGVGALLSYAFKPQLAGAIEQLRGGTPPVDGAK